MPSSEPRHLLEETSFQYIPTLPFNLSQISSADQCTAFIQLRLLDFNKASLLNEWFDGILTASQQWRRNAHAGRIVLKPPSNDGIQNYICMFRFKSWVLMSQWLRSSTRSHWMKKLDRLNITVSVSSDIQEGEVCFLPESMRMAGWKSLSGSAIEEEMVPNQQNQAPPPKWRIVIIIWLALQITVLPWTLTIDTVLSNLGMTLIWRVILSLICIVPIVDYVLVPLLDRTCHCFLFAPRCKPIEPCLSLQIGCACCRPSPPNASDHLIQERFRGLELQLQQQRRIQGSAKRRLVGRIEAMELGLYSLVQQEEQVDDNDNEPDEDEIKVKDVSNDSGEKENETVLEEEEEEEEEEDISVSLQTIDLLSTAMPANIGEEKTSTATTTTTTSTNIESSVVTIIVAYRVKINCIIQFEEWIHEMARQASTRVSGFRGEVVCQTPLIVLEQDPNAPTHVIVFQFDSKKNLQIWAKHSARRYLLSRLKPLLQENSLTNIKVTRHDSFGTILDSNWHKGTEVGSEDQSTSSAATTTNNAATGAAITIPATGFRHDPQRWKMAIVVAFALFLEIWFVGIPIVGKWLINVPKWFSIMLDTFIGVVLLTYILLPVLIWLMKKWLFVSWRISSNCCMQCIQRGFECWDVSEG